MMPLVPHGHREAQLAAVHAPRRTNTGEIVLSPSETKLMPLTPISAQSSRKSMIDLAW